MQFKTVKTSFKTASLAFFLTSATFCSGILSGLAWDFSSVSKSRVISINMWRRTPHSEPEIWGRCSIDYSTHDFLDTKAGDKLVYIFCTRWRRQKSWLQRQQHKYLFAVSVWKCKACNKLLSCTWASHCFWFWQRVKSGKRATQYILKRCSKNDNREACIFIILYLPTYRFIQCFYCSMFTYNCLLLATSFIICSQRITCLKTNNVL